MKEIVLKIMELEERRNDIEKVQKDLREEMVIADEDKLLEKEMIYYKNKEELKEINKYIDILNESLEGLKY